MRGLVKGRALGSIAAVVIALACGCGAEDEEPKSGNGVNDVKLACELRTNWNRTKEDCSLCESGVISPRCECSSLAAFSAACIDQQEARRKVCSEAVDNCVFACDRSDCACIERCYVSGDACKKASDARDGCVSETCAEYCK